MEEAAAVRLSDEHVWEVPAILAGRGQHISALHTWSGDLLPDIGSENYLWSDNQHGFKISYQLAGSAGNHIYIVDGMNLGGLIEVTGSDNRVIICGSCPWPSHLQVHVFGTGSTLYIGPGCTFNGTDMFLTGDGVSIVCGDDCMFSHATMVRTYDQHAIFDIASGDWINEPQSVRIGRHSWIGQEVLILKGADVGRGSIIGARSTVSGPLPPKTLSAGTPARVMKEGVSWVRDAHLDRKKAAEILSRLI